MHARVAKSSSRAPADLAERAKELHCLISVSRTLANRRNSVPDALARIVHDIPLGWRFPELAAARVTWRDNEWAARDFRSTAWSMKHEIRIRNGTVGSIEVAYRRRPPGAAPVFLPEEAQLLEAIAERIADIIELNGAEQELSTYQAQLRSRASQLAITEERERRDIATFLHDRIGQELALIKLKLETLRGCGREDEHNRVIDHVCDLAGDVLRSTRTLTFEVSPPILHELGLVPALEWLADHTRSRHGLAVTVDAQPITPLDDDIKTLVFRSTNELLNNVVRHASATSVMIRVRPVAHALRVEVDDDGRGFQPDRLVHAGAFGLFSIRERLTHVGGRLELVSAPGEGTRASIVAPLPKRRRRRR
jgi:signal transduction histidine kinase